MFTRNCIVSSNINNYSTPNSEHNWEDLCIQLINQQTCASIIVYDMNGVPISIQFSNKLYQRFANATPILMCNSNRNKLEIMKNEPNNTHIPYGQIQYVVLGQGQY